MNTQRKVFQRLFVLCIISFTMACCFGVLTDYVYAQDQEYDYKSSADVSGLAAAEDYHKAGGLGEVPEAQMQEIPFVEKIPYGIDDKPLWPSAAHEQAYQDFKKVETIEEVPFKENPTAAIMRTEIKEGVVLPDGRTEYLEPSGDLNNPNKDDRGWEHYFGAEEKPGVRPSVISEDSYKLGPIYDANPGLGVQGDQTQNGPFKKVETIEEVPFKENPTAAIMRTEIKEGIVLPDGRTEYLGPSGDLNNPNKDDRAREHYFGPREY